MERIGEEYLVFLTEDLEDTWKTLFTKQMVYNRIYQANKWCAEKNTYFGKPGFSSKFEILY